MAVPSAPLPPVITAVWPWMLKRDWGFMLLVMMIDPHFFPSGS